DDHWRTRNVARNVGRALALQQRYADALIWMDRAVDVSPPLDSPPDEGMRGGGAWGMRAQRAAVRFKLGRRDEALTEARTAVIALERATATAGDAASTLASTRVVLARLLIEAGRPRDAEPVLLAAIEWLQRLPASHPRVAEASCELARARLVQDRRAAAERA